MNGVLLQFFQWYSPPGVLWNELADKAASLAAAGFTALWIPPAGKASGGVNSVGYDTYDLFDLGEFDQKEGGPATKYGTKTELLAAIAAAHDARLEVYADVVFNHKDGGDVAEDVTARPMDWNDRNQPVGPWTTIKAWTGFTFPGRGDAHSTMKWSWRCFDAVSYDQNHPELENTLLFELKDKEFATRVSPEHGNDDYLLACDIDTSEPEVRAELAHWGQWFLKTTGVDGFRLDACKHIDAGFFPAWLDPLRDEVGRELFAVGEYWSGDVDQLGLFLAETEGKISLFDVPLHYRLHDAALAGGGYDMRTIFQDTLVEAQPTLAVTFVDNHDTQPGQSLESWVDDWFKPIAYALVLLRRDGYPCVFYADYEPQQTYDAGAGRTITLQSFRAFIDVFLAARRDYGFGEQHDYFDHPNTIGWIRTGDAEHPGVMAVVLTTGSDGTKRMNTFRPGGRFRDATGRIDDEIVADAEGWATFRCDSGSVSVWLLK